MNHADLKADAAAGHHDFLSAIVRIFLDSKLSILLILFSLLAGAAALWVTPREEDPQIVVPLADIYVNFPGYSAAEVEQLAATPLEKILYQIDGVEYVYSMSQENRAIITVRFYVGQDRERSLVKLFKKLNESIDTVPPGVTGWVVKPVEIDDVPILTLTLTGQDGYMLRRVGEEVAQRLAALADVSRAYVSGGEARTVRVDLDPERLQAYSLSPLEVRRALTGANVTLPSGEFARGDSVVHVEAGLAVARPEQLGQLVVGVFKAPSSSATWPWSKTVPARSPVTCGTAGGRGADLPTTQATAGPWWVRLSGGVRPPELLPKPCRL
jgi:multidrug efflux pump subunit AcrB